MESRCWCCKRERCHLIINSNIISNIDIIIIILSSVLHSACAYLFICVPFHPHKVLLPFRAAPKPPFLPGFFRFFYRICSRRDTVCGQGLQPTLCHRNIHLWRMNGSSLPWAAKKLENIPINVIHRTQHLPAHCIIQTH